MNLIEYVLANTERGECTCGRCIDKGDKPDPAGHTADVMFFKVAMKGTPDADTLRSLVKSHQGEFANCNPFDGQEHNYMELGGWIGDQALAMRFMALAFLLKLCNLMTPRTMIPDLPNELAMQMAGQGMVSIQAVP
jgi:hypothetical protein